MITWARAVQRKLVRKRGLTRKQVILLPRYSPRNPPTRQVGMVAKVNKLARKLSISHIYHGIKLMSYQTKISVLQTC